MEGARERPDAAKQWRGKQQHRTEPTKRRKKTRSMAEIRIGSRSRRETGTARPPGQRSHFLSHFLHCALVDRLIDSAASANDPLAPFRRPRFIVRSIRYEKKNTHTHQKNGETPVSTDRRERGRGRRIEWPSQSNSSAVDNTGIV